MTPLTLFLFLLTAHLLGDFLFQRTQWVEDKMSKGIRSLGLLYHIIVHAFLLMPLIVLGYLNWWEWAIILLSHYLIDLGKIYAMRFGREGVFFTLDQLLHISVLLFIVFWPSLKIGLDVQIPTYALLIMTICILLLTRVSGIIIHYILKPWSDQLEEDKEASLEKAGTFIGNLERIFVFFLALFDQLSAIGFLIAAKSVFRFGDLQKSKGRKLTEYVLIGTMLSFGFALTIYLLYEFLWSLRPD